MERWKVLTVNGARHSVDVEETRYGYVCRDATGLPMRQRSTALMLVAAIADKHGWAAVKFIAPGEAE